MNKGNEVILFLLHNVVGIEFTKKSKNFLSFGLQNSL